jgi:hypothetical protein
MHEIKVHVARLRRTIQKGDKFKQSKMTCTVHIVLKVLG